MKSVFFFNLRKGKYVFLLVVICTYILSACSKNSNDNENDNGDTSGNTSGNSNIDSTYTSGTAEGSVETGEDADDLVESSTFSNTITITYGSSVTIDNPLEGNGVDITTTNNDVTVNASVGEVAYIVQGTSSNGSLKMYSTKKFKLTLNGLSLTNTDGPAINIQSSKRVFVIVAENTTNTLTDGSTYTTAANDEDQKAAFFSEGQLIFSGTGNLTVNGNYKHGICSDDYIRVREGNLTISKASSDGIHTNNGFIGDGGTINIAASSDGIEAEEGFIIINDGYFTINVADDGIAASYEEGDTSIDPFVTINGGTFIINTTEGEGIESKSVLTINNGTIVAKTVDDGLNAGTAIYINGGNVFAQSSTNDGMDSNGIFTVTGGKVVAIGAISPEAGIDCDARTLKITGGILVGIGGATSAPSASASTVPSVIMGSGNANQIIHIEAEDRTEALTFLAPVSYSTLLFAGSKLKTNTTYNVYTGGSVTSGTDFNELYTSGTYEKGNKGNSFTTSSMVTQIGGSVSRG